MKSNLRPDARNAARDVPAAKAAVTELLEVLGWLAAALLPGTAKSYRAPQMSAEKRAEADARARLERGAYDVGTGTTMPLGESPVPLDLDVADLLSEIMAAADALCDVVSDAAGVDRMAPASSAFADPKPYLARVLELLPVAVDVAGVVAERCEALVFRARSTLGLVTDGQLLDATCPWCGGRTSRHPVGGAKTLRVRLLPSVNPKTGEDEDIPAVVCESGTCAPPEADVGSWYRAKHPAWIESEWAWLSARIERMTEAAS